MPISNPVVYCNPANIGWDLRDSSRQTVHFYSYFWTPSFRGTPALCVGFYAPEMYLQCMASVLCITHLNHCFSFIAYKKKKLQYPEAPNTQIQNITAAFSE